MNRESQVAIPKSSRLSASILFLIIFITIAILIWQWSDRQGYTTGLQRTIAEYITNVDFLGKKPRQLIAEVEATKEETRKQLNKLGADITISPVQREAVEKLSNLIEKIDALPFAMDNHLIKVDLAKLVSPQDNRWHKFINDIWQDLQQFIVVQRIDNPEIVLLSPSQRQLLQENIKLQLLLAQFSFLSHDQINFQTNLETAVNLIKRHYDTQAESVVDLLNQVNQLYSYPIEAPFNVSKRLDTVRNYQLIQ
ncbi:uroporphyrinogen-III C-methyltransferase [Nitrosomonas communis]|uniref:uroporphyrinogen-III C-methyltransferase n=1 Tax=Nitrosomonas communis TaxID=44574 RepID=UPI0026ED5B4E|nr:uroporphyrinogen-III C-methyltransferase [Nitrosomonas communis]MCO6427833.1 uroporphyrinogen-III C-methyltransferase [Nitrosomonas communis]